MTGAIASHPATHKQPQTYPRGARPGTTNCFLLCCHPFRCAGWTPESLFALCSEQIPPPRYTHCCALSLSNVQGFSRGWGNTVCRLLTSPIDHSWSWGLKTLRNQTSHCWHQPVAWLWAADWWHSAGRVIWDVSSCLRDKHYSQMFRNTSFAFVSSVVAFLIVLEST